MKVLFHILSYPMVFIMAFLYKVCNPENNTKFISELDKQWTKRYRELTEAKNDK